VEERLMGWYGRAVFTKAKVEKGQNVLITGIGGGVAITALQFCVAVGELWLCFDARGDTAPTKLTGFSFVAKVRTFG
jgi:D-arabinose 1-dehydrogenase-like Zn-dependent alcohol dehydrogenase